MLDARRGWIRVGWIRVIPVAALAGCGERTAELELERECVRARVLDIDISPDRITRTGRTLDELSSWSIAQLEPDGSLTPVVELDVELDIVDYYGSIEHDPESGRMWLLAWSYEELPAWLFQFDASGQIEWAEELDEPGIIGGSLLHHDGALVVTAGVEAGMWRNLIVERRDLAGEVVWTRGEIPTPDGGAVFASGGPIGVVDGALALIATPPLIDYGPSYSLTLDFATGESIWSDEDGHDPLRMVVDDEHLYLAWTTGPRFDSERLPIEYIELEPASSSLQVVTPDGEELAKTEVEWPTGWRRFEEDGVALVWVGDRLVSVVEGREALGLTVHTKELELECQAKLDPDLDLDRLWGWAISLEGREQALVRVAIRTGEPNQYGEYETVPGVLLLEPL